MATILGVSGVEIIKQLMRNGVMANLSQVVDFETAAIIATDLGFEPKELVTVESADLAALHKELLAVDDPAKLKPRPPVVTILGHVDHGKTTLLDAIRQTKVAAGEAGGITQHIGAYQVEVNGHTITFLDTPGHEAFTAMRARGAKVTDIAVLVVAADDGVMPQTIEAINHVKAAGVPIVVALNKIDKPEANPDKIKQQLTEHGLVVEEWGGEVIAVPVSAKGKKGIKELLENILVVAEVGELKADPDHRAAGVVVEARLDNTKGPVATILVQNGTLNVGDAIVVGDGWGKIKAMLNDQGKRIKSAGPASPAEVLGLSTVPKAGSLVVAFPDEKSARAFVSVRQKERDRAPVQAIKPPTLDDLFARMKAGEVKELDIILKTDVQGSIEPLVTSLEKLSGDKARLKVLHAGTGTITESDVLLAIASKAIVIGFTTRVEPGAKALAAQEGVDVRLYDIIYNLVDDVRKALEGILPPTLVEVIDGHAQIRAVFSVGKKEKIAGVIISDGKAVRGEMARVIRGGKVLADTTIGSLKRFKDDAKEVLQGFECGIGLEGFNDIAVGDIIEIYKKEKSTPK